MAQIFFVNGIYFGHVVIGVDIPFDNGCGEPIPLRIAQCVFMWQYGDVPLGVDGRVDQGDEDAEFEKFFHVTSQLSFHHHM